MKTFPTTLMMLLALSAHARAPRRAHEHRTHAVAASKSIALPALPVARTVDSTETRFGVRWPDPYRWMEGANNAETAEWLRAQGAYTHAWLARLPGRDRLLARVRALGMGYGYPYGVQLAGGRTFHFMLGAGEQVPKLMVREADGRDRVLVDPAKLGSKGSHASVNSYAPSFDGRLVAYLLSEGGSEVSTIHVMDVSTGREQRDRIAHIWGEFPPSWLPDASGFFYTQMAEAATGVDPMLNMRARLHRLGTPVDQDPVVLVGKRAPRFALEPQEFPGIVVPPGTPWMVAYASGARSEARFAVARLADLDRSGRAATAWTVVCNYADGVENLLLHGDRLYIMSHKNASGRRVLSVPAAHPSLGSARVEIAENKDEPLQRLTDSKDALYAERMVGGGAQILRLPWGSTKATPLALPYVGWTNELTADPERDGAVFDLEGWTRPGTFFSTMPGRAEAEPVLESQFTGDMSNVVADEIEVPSAGGVRVPLSILHLEGMALDGSHPTIVYGYGGYGISQTPSFSPTRLAWLERGGVFAVAHVRGGSEKGYAWQVTGTGPHKMNGIRDFIACGEYLVAHHITTPERMAAQGGSMGGVLVGRAITERPDLFGSANIAVGIVNPLRLLAAENGANQIAEMGDPRTAAGYRALYEMDAYAHVRSAAYPATIFTVGLNDRRVAPWMTAKMAARMQVSTTSGKPVLVRVESDAGHGIGSTRDQAYAERADVWSFLLAEMGDPAFRVPSP